MCPRPDPLSFPAGCVCLAFSFFLTHPALLLALAPNWTEQDNLSYVPANGTKTKAPAASEIYLASDDREGFGNGDVAEAPAEAPAGFLESGEKTKETLALEEIRETFKEFNLPDQTYCRYLRARHWDVKKATVLIQKYVEWRSEMKPESIQWNDIEEEFRTGKVYRLNLSDFKNRHVVILSPGKQNTKNHQQQMKQLVYTMESAIGMKAKEVSPNANMNLRAGAKPIQLLNPNPSHVRVCVRLPPSSLLASPCATCLTPAFAPPACSLPRAQHRHLLAVAPVTTPAAEQLIVLLDFTGYTLRNAPPYKTSLETLKILQDYYCERLGEAMLLNPPGVFRVLWKLIRPFIDKRTLKKINFLPRNFKECDILKERFNLDDLDTALGGRGDHPYDHDKYGAIMMAEDEARKSRPPVIPPRPSPPASIANGDQ